MIRINSPKLGDNMTFSSIEDALYWLSGSIRVWAKEAQENDMLMGGPVSSLSVYTDRIEQSLRDCAEEIG